MGNCFFQNSEAKRFLPENFRRGCMYTVNANEYSRNTVNANEHSRQRAIYTKYL